MKTLKAAYKATEKEMIRLKGFEKSAFAALWDAEQVQFLPKDKVAPFRTEYERRKRAYDRECRRLTMIVSLLEKGVSWDTTCPKADNIKVHSFCPGSMYCRYETLPENVRSKIGRFYMHNGKGQYYVLGGPCGASLKDAVAYVLFNNGREQ